MSMQPEQHRRLVVLDGVQVAVDKSGEHVGLQFLGLESPGANVEPTIAVVPSDRIPELIKLLQTFQEEFGWPEAEGEIQTTKLPPSRTNPAPVKRPKYAPKGVKTLWV